MSVDWRRLSRDAGFAVRDAGIDVSFADGRRQFVHVEESKDGQLRLWSVVASASTVQSLPGPHLHAWRRNRLTKLVGFRVDRRGRMVGEAFPPVVGLGAEEWELHVRTLARACDRVEFVLSGRDEA